MPRITRFIVLAALLVGAIVLPGSSARAASAASNGYPYCSAGSASDPDGDGWGWEDNASCVVRYSRADPGTSGPGNSSPGACPAGMSCGSYSVGGLGARKELVLTSGGDSLDLAIAMLETDTMTADYAFGDHKSADAANFGIFKQNWLMLRSACSRFRGQQTGDWNTAAVLNGDLRADVGCLNESQAFYGLDRWFAGHRNGSSGLDNPYTQDIRNYRSAVEWIRGQIDATPGGAGNDTRWWVSVPAI